MRARRSWPPSRFCYTTRAEATVAGPFTWRTGAAVGFWRALPPAGPTWPRPCAAMAGCTCAWISTRRGSLQSSRKGNGAAAYANDRSLLQEVRLSRHAEYRGRAHVLDDLVRNPHALYVVNRT